MRLYRLVGRMDLARRFRTVLALCCLVFASASHAQEAGANYALVIGINDYLAEIENLPPLTYAVPDANAVKEALEQKNFQVVALTDSEARRGAIIAQLTKYSRDLKPEDTLLIYFAGHGVRATYGDRSYSYWLTHDTSLARLEVDAIRVNHLLDYVIDIPTKRRILILDHCHSGDVAYAEVVAGAGRDASGGLSIRRNAFALDEFEAGVSAALAEGLIILGAATDTAYEYPDLGHGVFTYAFLEALTTPSADKDNNGVLSTDELRGHVINRTKQIAAQKRSVQKPIEFASGAITWDFATLGGSALEKLLTEIEGNLDTAVLLRCVEAIENYGAGIPTSDDQVLIDAMRSLATSTGSPVSKATVLKIKVNSLQS